MFQQIRGIVAGAVLAASALAVHAPAYANGTPPNGSYQQTCTKISVSGSTLYARCWDSAGNLKDTQLANYAAAGGQDIANCNGVLTVGKCPKAHH
ncbi:MAG: hypothetical protein RLZZ08_114 [Pseudomonadota bacterium]